MRRMGAAWGHCTQRGWEVRGGSVRACRSRRRRTGVVGGGDGRRRWRQWVTGRHRDCEGEGCGQAEGRKGWESAVRRRGLGGMWGSPLDGAPAVTPAWLPAEERGEGKAR